MTTLLLAALQGREQEMAGWVGLIMGGVFSILVLIITLILLVSLWKIVEKAGKPGWAGIVPFYNVFVLVEIVGKPVWWAIVMCFVPCVNIILSVMLALELARVFGKGTGFAIGLILLPFVFYPILAFGDAQYRP